ncbi:MAG: ice-binding family protein [Solirubrobacteraceae bacterium]
MSRPNLHQRAAVVLAAVLVFAAVPSAAGASTAMVNLGQASTYAALSGASVGNTVSAVGAPYTTLRGDLGVKANAQPTGFPPGVVTGAVNVGNSAAAAAHADLVTAYGNVAARTGGATLAPALVGATISPGLYTIAGAASNTGTVTLDGGGDPNGVFVIQVNGALAFAAASHVVLTNGAQASHVFWQVNGAGAIGANSTFAGTLMAFAAVGVGNGSVVNGRLLALNGALTLDFNQVYSAPPVVTITGAASAYTANTTPTISGTTDVAAPGVVTVTMAGQTLTSTPSHGAWSVTSPMLPNGTYAVLASVTDGAGNPGSATQQLTVNTVLPVVTIDGGPNVVTNHTTPTIAGSSDAAPGTIVNVTVDSQALTALVQPGGRWNVTPTALSDGTRTITASVTDLAGNIGTRSQVLTVSTAAPAVTITGGANALTNNATAYISGTANVASGTPVIVALADQTLTGLVQDGGGWSVTAARLSDGPHRVVMSVTDAAGNSASATQMLTVDTVAPVITITGGPTATTTNHDPTITGTSDATSGTTVTVSIARQTITTLVQANGTWNVTATSVPMGTWQVIASAPDPAGNVGSARQTLTINSDALSGSGGTGATGSTGSKGGTGSTGGAGATGGSGSKGGTGGTGGTGSTGRGGATGGSGSKGGTGGTGGTGSTGGPRLTVSLPAAGVTTARGEPVRVPFVLSGPGKVTMTVLRGHKVVVKLIVTLRKAGHGRLTWNGKINGKLAPRGAYKVIVQAVSRTGASSRDVVTVHIA